MTTNLRRLPVLLLCALLAVAVVPVGAQSSAMQPFAEANHRLAFEYPAGWDTLLYSPDFVYLSNLEDRFYDPSLQVFAELLEGQVSLHLELKPKARFSWLADSVNDPRQFLIWQVKEWAETTDQVYEVHVNGKPAARLDEGYTTWVLFPVDEANYVLATLYIEPAALSEFVPTLNDILASVRLVPEQGHNIPLEPLTAFNVDQLALLATIYTEDAVNGLDFSPDGRDLLVAGGDTTTIWDVATLQPISTFGDAAYRAIYHPSGAIIVTISRDESLLLWDRDDLTHSALIGEAGETAYASGLTFSPDGALLAFATSDHHIQLWDVEAQSDAVVLHGHTDDIAAVEFSSDGRLLASVAYNEDHVKIWGVQDGTLVNTIPTGEATNLAFSPSNSLIALNTQEANEPSPQLWDIESGQLVMPMNASISFFHSLQFSDDGALLLGLDVFFGKLSIWSVFTGEPLVHIQAQSGFPVVSSGFALSPDHKFIATGAAYDSIRLWGVPAV